MKKHFKGLFIGSFLATILLTGIAVSAGATKGNNIETTKQGATLNGEVELLSAKAYRQTSGWTKDSSITAKVKVKNLSYIKKLTFHAQLEDDSWIDLDQAGYTVDAQYQYSVSGGYEIWSVTARKNSYNTSEYLKETFAVKYVANGKTYWDNNNGKNYVIGYNGYIMNEELKVEQYEANAYQYQNDLNETVTPFYGSALIPKGVPTGKLEVVYTTDNWTITKKIPATDYDTDKGICNFSVELPNNPKNIEYAIAYTENATLSASQVYWDNNFGKNYKIVLN